MPLSDSSQEEDEIKKKDIDYNDSDDEGYTPCLSVQEVQHPVAQQTVILTDLHILFYFLFNFLS